MLELNQEIVAVRGRVGRDLLVHLPFEYQLDQRLREGLHLEESAVRDRIGDLLALAVTDQIGDTRVRDHHFDRRHAPAADAREQALADDAAQNTGEDRADLPLLRLLEELDIAGNRLGGVDRVHRRHDQMPRLGRLHGGLGRLAVAELADQDHVRVLAQGAP